MGLTLNHPQLKNRPARTAGFLRSFGNFLYRHSRAVRRIQYAVILIYLALMIVPILLPLPGRSDHILSNITLFAQFVFWGIWWPFVLLSMIVFGRLWCGVFCPEGALSEIVSEHGRGRAIPRWITWGGWPVIGFIILTVFGQMVSVYQYPKPVVLILGGSTAIAMLVGYLYGKKKRVWCRYLCPVNGVFGLLSKLAPVHFQVDGAAWERSQRLCIKPEPINCAPLVAIRQMKGTSHCHMCARCDGFRDAIELAPRAPNYEVVRVAGMHATPWETLLIVFSMMGVGAGAFHWSVSPWYIDLKQALAEFLINHGILWPLEHGLPWWLLTNYPDRNDVLTVLDGFTLLVYVFGTATLVSIAVFACLALATRLIGAWSWARFHHFAQALIPVAGCGVFLGLSAFTVTLLKADGVHLPYVTELRAALLLGALAWVTGLGWRISGLYVSPVAAAIPRRVSRTTATLAIALAGGVGVWCWYMYFWGF